MHVSDDIFLGPAIGPNPSDSNPSPMSKGVGPLGRVYIFDVVPLALGAANIAALQTTAGAASLALTAGTGTTSVIDAAGTARITLDCARCVTLASTADLHTVNFTIKGYDFYGQATSCVIAGPNNNTVTTLKAFKSVISVATSAAVGTNVSIGTADVLGFPVAVTAGYVLSRTWGGLFTQDTGTITAAVATTPATTATGDVRGKYALSSAADGSNRLIVAVALNALACGPQATRVGAFGVTQV